MQKAPTTHRRGSKPTAPPTTPTSLAVVRGKRSAPPPDLAPPPVVMAGPTLAHSGYLRLEQIVGNPRKGVPAIIPVSKTTWWHKCKTDPTWPQPVKLSERCTAWLAADVMALVHRLAKGEVRG